MYSSAPPPPQKLSKRRTWGPIARGAVFCAGLTVGAAFAQTQSISLTADMVTHESFRLSWTPDTATDDIEFQRIDGIWESLTTTGNDDAPFIATAATTRFNVQGFVDARTTPWSIRIREDLDTVTDADDTFSNVVTITLRMPDGSGGGVTGNPPAEMPGGGDEMETEMPGEMTGGDDNTAADATDDAVLPEILRQQHRGIQDGIFNRIQQRQREDGKWK